MDAQATFASNETLSPQQATYLKELEEEREFFKKHQGHEMQHFVMFVIFLGAIAGSQIVFFFWKRHHLRSFQLATVIGLWLIPAAFCIYGGLVRFLIIWAIYSLANGWIIHRATQTPLHHLTPALVYKWFQILYRVTYAVAMSGYILIMLSIVGITQIFFNVENIVAISADLLFYGLYFGVFSRDLVELCADRMASSIGYYNKDGLPNKQLSDGVCAICGANIDVGAGPDGHNEHEGFGRYELAFGKRDMCPYCKEKVDLKSFSSNPWDTQQLFYLNLLDAIRYMMVWYPIILGVVQLSYKIFGLQ
ncbi:hypothetical protein BDF19DRAFT_447002 [Syncephalis fuscata]|nr:hypothetical protein BDF19DRAFT_447002 [Syncephalis fuscata]